MAFLLRARALALPAVVLLAAAPAAAQDPAAPAPAPTRKPLDPKDRAIVLAALRGYLDLESGDYGEHRLTLLRELRRLKAAGVDVLGNREELTSLLYASRHFRPAFEKKLVDRSDRTSEIVFDPATNVVSVQWQDRPGMRTDPLRLSVSLPAGYAELAKPKPSGGRLTWPLWGVAPYPAIVTLHELSDFLDAKGTKKFPGAEVIRRRWDRKANKLLDGWFVFAPVATRARFSEDGRVPSERVALSELWTRYHVDFDRIVLEGGSDALLLAAAQPSFFAGLIVRESEKADLPSDDLVCNLQSLPVYVVGKEDAPVVRRLRAGGHAADRLTVGGPEGLAAWLSDKEKVRRAVPTSFRWVVKDPDAHSFAHWVNVEQVEAGVKDATFRVEVARDTNTIKLESRGVRSVSFLLAESVVDLDREVSLVVNGSPVKELRIASPSGNKPEGIVVKMPAKFERTLDGVLDPSGQVSVRQTQYYALSAPVTLLKVPVRGDTKDTKGLCGAPAGGATDDGAGGDGGDGDAERARLEREASQYFAKAEEREKANELAKALDLYRKAAAVGTTSLLAQAQAKVKELEVRVGAGEGPK